MMGLKKSLDLWHGPRAERFDAVFELEGDVKVVAVSMGGGICAYTVWPGGRRGHLYGLFDSPAEALNWFLTGAGRRQVFDLGLVPEGEA